MGHAPRVVAAAKRAILDLGARANDPISFRVELRGVLAKLLVLDAFCVNTSDPATLLITGSVGDGLPPDRATRLFEIEYLEPDYSKLTELALGLRLSVLRGAPADASPDAPGLILLSSDGKTVDSMNEAARRWIDELEGEKSEPLPHSICAVAQRARAAPGDGAASSARARLQTRGGRWLTVHGTQLGGRVAVVMERAQPHEVAPIILRAYELSPREEGVVQLLLHGKSNEEIAADLALSVYTVKDHMKSIFRKVGAASRSEVTAKIFVGQYVPRIAKRRGLAGNGWFALERTGS